MATTRPLNDNQTVWCTTYAGKSSSDDTRTCFDMSMQISEEEQVTATFTTEQLRSILMIHGTIQGLRQPDFDRG